VLLQSETWFDKFIWCLDDCKNDSADRAFNLQTHVYPKPEFGASAATQIDFGISLFVKNIFPNYPWLLFHFPTIVNSFLNLNEMATVMILPFLNFSSRCDQIDTQFAISRLRKQNENLGERV
jgi:hypothetical protein